MDIRFIIMPIKAPRKTMTTLSGKYENPVCSIICIRRIPSAKMHSTKKIAIELLCSSSAALFSGNGAASEAPTIDTLGALDGEGLTGTICNIELLDGPIS